jgi:hypothetical protein
LKIKQIKTNKIENKNKTKKQIKIKSTLKKKEDIIKVFVKKKDNTKKIVIKKLKRASSF